MEHEKEIKKMRLMFLLIPIIPALILFKHSHLTAIVILLATFWSIFILTLISKTIANFIYIYSKKTLKILGDTLAKIALFLIYVCAVIPTGLIMKLSKRDRLRLKKQNLESYWKDIKEENPNHEYQF